MNSQNGSDGMERRGWRWLSVMAVALVVGVGCADTAVADNDQDPVEQQDQNNGEEETNGEEPEGVEPWDCDPDLALSYEGYESVEGMEGEDLFQGLRAEVIGHNGRGYNAARTFMFEQLEPNDEGLLECVYTDDLAEPDGTNLPSGVFNTEHVWPQSRGADTEPERSDMHHLFPVEIDANNRRANYEFGYVGCDGASCDWGRDGSYLGPSADDDRDPVFEVQPDRRGDIARAVLYFSLRYDEGLSSGEEAALRAWHCEDPPDDYERARNDAIEGFQSNRNPFIDRPDFVDRIDQF